MDMSQLKRPFSGSRIVDRLPVRGQVQDWPSNTVRYISRRWRGPVHIQAESADFNLRNVAIHEHVERGKYPLHNHPHSELLLTLEGEGILAAPSLNEKMTCGVGALWVLPPRIAHRSQWHLREHQCWKVLILDFDLAFDLGRQPLEDGDRVDLSFSPFFEWFYQHGGLKLDLSGSAWPAILAATNQLQAALAEQNYGVAAELLSGTLRLICAISRTLRDRGLADGRHAGPSIFSKHSALLKARTLMEHRGWFDPGCVGRLAREVGMAETHFIREFRAAYGLTPKKYSQQVLLRRACALLDETKLSVSDIATRLGYEDPSIFSRAFRNGMGISPAIYRQRPKSLN